jgi:hypothetical protein
LSLEAYSRLHNRTIDSIELVFKIQIQEEIYHKVIIGDISSTNQYTYTKATNAGATNAAN